MHVMQAFVNKIHSMKKALLMVPDGDNLRASGNLDGTFDAEISDADMVAGAEPHTLSQSDVEKSEPNPLSED